MPGERRHDPLDPARPVLIETGAMAPAVELPDWLQSDGMTVQGLISSVSQLEQFGMSQIRIASVD